MRYIIRKVLTLIITLFMVSLLAFLAFQVIPGSPASSMLGTNATPEKIAALEAEMGLDDPVLVRYARWAGDFIQGDWGQSYSYDMPVKDMVMEKLPATAALVLLAFAITVAAAFPLGIATARREGSLLDRVITVVNQVCMSIPPVFVGILLCFLFGITLRVFVPGNFVSFQDSPGQFFLYMLFPALSVALSRIAMTVKMLRSSILDEMNKDYIRTAFSRGRTRADALRHHALRNAIIPVIAFLPSPPRSWWPAASWWSRSLPSPGWGGSCSPPSAAGTSRWPRRWWSCWPPGWWWSTSSPTSSISTWTPASASSEPIHRFHAEGRERTCFWLKNGTDGPGPPTPAAPGTTSLGWAASSPASCLC